MINIPYYTWSTLKSSSTYYGSKRITNTTTTRKFISIAVFASHTWSKDETIRRRKHLKNESTKISIKWIFAVIFSFQFSFLFSFFFLLLLLREFVLEGLKLKQKHKSKKVFFPRNTGEEVKLFALEVVKTKKEENFWQGKLWLENLNKKKT